MTPVRVSVSHEDDVVDHLDLSALPNLSYLSFNFFVQADNWGADNWAPWLAAALAKLSSRSSSFSQSPTPPSSLSSPSSTSSSSNLSPIFDYHRSTSRNRIETIRIRLEFGFTEADDLYLDLSKWRRVDDVLCFQDDFPHLREVRVDVVCVDDATKPFLESLLVDLKAQFPKLTWRGLLRIQEGREYHGSVSILSDS